MLKGYNKTFNVHALKIIASKKIDRPDGHTMMGSAEIQHSLKKQPLPCLHKLMKPTRKVEYDDTNVTPSIVAGIWGEDEGFGY